MEGRGKGENEEIEYIEWILSRSHIQTAASVMITQGVVRASTYGMSFLIHR